MSLLLTLEPSLLQLSHPVQVHFPVCVKDLKMQIQLLRCYNEEYETYGNWKTVMQFNSSTAEEEIRNSNCTFNVRTGHLSLSKFGTFCWIGQPVESETKKKPVHWSVFGYCHMRKWIIDICIHDYCYHMLEVIRCSYIFLMHMLLILTEGSCICL